MRQACRLRCSFAEEAAPPLQAAVSVTASDIGMDKLTSCYTVEHKEQAVATIFWSAPGHTLHDL